ncbi:hypothetical protein DSECCO2_124950 [anaerobic digester metagenome]
MKINNTINKPISKVKITSNIRYCTKFFFKGVKNMDQKRMWELSAAFITFTVVSLVSIELLYYLMGYPLDTNLEGHRLLATIGFLIGVAAAYSVYSILKRS